MTLKELVKAYETAHAGTDATGRQVAEWIFEHHRDWAETKRANSRQDLSNDKALIQQIASEVNIHISRPETKGDGGMRGKDSMKMATEDMENSAELKSEIEALAERSKHAQRHALTEEATKTAVILPLIRALGFDIFNLNEVVPEYVADVGVKKGEKVDFALKIDGEIVMLVEAKPVATNLGKEQYTQLSRYFHATEARVAILTNGREVWFFSDTASPNIMDRKPFFVFDIQKHDTSRIEKLAKFQKDVFDKDSILSTATDLRYQRDAVTFFKKQFDEPDEDFVRSVARQIHDGSVGKNVMDRITPAIQSALDQIVKDRIEERLGVTFQSGTPVPEQPVADTGAGDDSGTGIVTTDEEIEAFRIVRAIGARMVPVDRITMKDAKSYCAIFFEGNNRKPICRLYFNSKANRKIGLFGPDKTETKVSVDGPDGLYKFQEEILAVISHYADVPAPGSS